DQRVKMLFEPVIDAIVDRSKQSGLAPYPSSKVIAGITWAAKETIIRKAKGSDNWPLTWADDDLQYTAYGDGWGFEPFVPQKLGLGFARVEGDPPNFHGENLRSPTGEQIGDGAKAKKASGILCAGGVLYLWTRNAGNAQLAWSKGHGTTWEWPIVSSRRASAAPLSLTSARITPAPATTSSTSTRTTVTAPTRRLTA